MEEPGGKVLVDRVLPLPTSRRSRQGGSNSRLIHSLKQTEPEHQRFAGPAIRVEALHPVDGRKPGPGKPRPEPGQVSPSMPVDMPRP